MSRRIAAALLVGAAAPALAAGAGVAQRGHAAACARGPLPQAGWARVSRLRGYTGEDVAFSSRCAGVVVGTRLGATGLTAGAALATADGGRSLVPRRLPRGVADLKAVAVVGRRVWAAGTGSHGGAIVASGDGGRHWREQTVPRRTPPLRALAFADARRGWAAGANTLLATSDGGRTWTRRTLAGASAVYALAFVGQRGWAAGSAQRGAAILATDDGGRSWRAQRSGVRSGALFRVAFLDAAHGWAAGAAHPERGGQAVLLATANGGRTWRRLPVARASIVAGVRFVTPRVGWIAVQSGTRGEIRFTADGGRTWRVQLRSEQLGPGPLVFRGRDSGWLIGDFGLYATTTGGR